MSNEEYEELWHYSEQFTRDKLQRSELVTMAWKEGRRLGKRSTPGLMKSMMHFRAKELNRRSAFPTREVGKRTLDAWNHERVYVDRVIQSDGCRTALADFLLPMRITPLDFTIANDFISSLNDDERKLLDAISAGYKLKEISIDKSRIPSLRQSLQQKAVAYL
jgi:hypothetical protein